MKNLIGPGLLVVAATLVFMGKLILEREYTVWSSWIARGLLAFAAIGVPRRLRSATSEEWEAELDALQRDENNSGVLFAAGLVVAAARIRGVAIGRSLRNATRVLAIGAGRSRIRVWSRGLMAFGISAMAAALVPAVGVALFAATIVFMGFMLFGVVDRAADRVGSRARTLAARRQAMRTVESSDVVVQLAADVRIVEVKFKQATPDPEIVDRDVDT